MCRKAGEMTATALHNCSDSGSSKKSRGISRGGRCQGTALAFGRVRETSPDVVARQLREIGQNLRLRHATCQIAQNVANRNASASNARLTKADGGSTAIRSSKFIVAVYGS